MLFILGVSITLNVILTIIILIIYRYSVKGVLNRIEKDIFKGYEEIDISKIGE